MKRDELDEKFQHLANVRGETQIVLFAPIHPFVYAELIGIVNQLVSEEKTEVIDLVLNSPGGSAADAYRMIRLLKDHFSKVNIIVPFWAKSAATLVALGADQIVMSSMGELGPLDAQVSQDDETSPNGKMGSALVDEAVITRVENRAIDLHRKMFKEIFADEGISLNKNELSKEILDFTSQLYHPILDKINPRSIGKNSRYLEVGKQYALRILEQFHPEQNNDKQNRLVSLLVEECPDHGYVIDYHLLSRFLSNVITSGEMGKKYFEVLEELAIQVIRNELSQERDTIIVKRYDPIIRDQSSKSDFPEVVQK